MLIWILCLVPVFGTSQITERACFSVPGGFYEESFNLELYPFYQQHHIRFTTNGNRPTAQSQLYTEPLLLDGSLYSTSDIYTIQISPENLIYIPDSIEHCIVIRAAVFDENDSCISAVSTNSYFIGALGCDTHGLPAISICADSLDLFDYQRGIMVPGAHWDASNPDWTGNYYQKGIAWERLINMEFYELDNTGINQEAGMRTHGGNARRFQQKGLKLYAKEEYGNHRFEHRFFEEDSLDSFKHLVLKPFASSWLQSGVANHVCNQIARSVNVESLESRPAILFLNGEYWGVYYIQERPDERYLKDHFDVDLDQVNIMVGWNPTLDYGTTYYFRLFYNWLETADLNDEANWDYVKEHVDIPCFIDYQILEMFLANMDWPANNIRCWQLNDGPLRWIFYDGDGCLSSVQFDVFANALYVGPNIWPASTKSTLFFRKFMENYEFFTAFNDRFEELLNTTFQDSVTLEYLSAIRNQIEAEVPSQSVRFGKPESMERWEHDITYHLYFLVRRVGDMRASLLEYFDVEETELAGIFPNPFTDELHLGLPAGATSVDEIQIFDLLGREVFAQSCSVDATTQEITIHPHLTPGIYFLKMGNHVTKIVRR